MGAGSKHCSINCTIFHHKGKQQPFTRTDNPLICDSVGNQQIITRWSYYKEQMCRETCTFWLPVCVGKVRLGSCWQTPALDRHTWIALYFLASHFSKLNSTKKQALLRPIRYLRTCPQKSFTSVFNGWHDFSLAPMRWGYDFIGFRTMQRVFREEVACKQGHK